MFQQTAKFLVQKNIGRGKYHKEIKQRKNKDGYMVITVGTNKNRQSKRVHRIIAEAFIDNPKQLPEIDHIDRDRTNNNVENLRWISSFDNKAQIPFNVRSNSHKGSLNGRAKLTEADIIEIRQKYSNGTSTSNLAKEYGRGWSTIHNIVTNQT